MKYCLSNMMALDIYLSTTRSNPIKNITDNRLMLPLMSWDIFSQFSDNHSIEANRIKDLKKLESLAVQLNWDKNYSSLFNEEKFEAIIVTNIDQEILWVNKGFSSMTGYSKHEALKKTPRFLQGNKTSDITKKQIRKQLNSSSPFKEVIINYKKNGEPYKCEVKIYPLYNSQKEKTHYIAFERQVS